MEDMWLARDQNGSLCLFIGEKPKKYKTYWHDWSGGWKRINSNLFPEVKWLDEEPTKIKLVIEKC